MRQVTDDQAHYCASQVRQKLRKLLRSRRHYIQRDGAVFPDFDAKVRFAVDLLDVLGEPVGDDTANLDREMLAAALDATVPA